MSFYDVNPVAMPVADMIQGSRRYTNVMSEDFITPVPIGGFIPKQSDPGSGLLLTGAAAAPYASKLMVYPSGFNAGAIGKSRPEKVLSVENSCLTYNFSVDAVTGEAMAATVHFRVGTATYNGSTSGYYVDPAVGGRFMFRFRVVNDVGLVGFGGVSQLIANSADWSASHGEMDINEGAFYGFAPHGMETNQHWQGSANVSTQWSNQIWGTGWHTSCYDWIPVGDPLEPAGRETVWIDGIKVGESLGDRIAANFRAFFAFQTGVNTTPPPADGVTYAANGQTRGQLQVDWVSVYRPTTVNVGTVQVSRLGVALAPAPTGKVQVSRLGVQVPVNQGKVQVSRLRVVSAGLPGKVQVSRLAVKATPSASYAQTIEPFATVTIPGSNWTQTGGPACAVGNPAPGTRDGCTLYYLSGSAQAVITVLPNTIFFDTTGSLPAHVVTA